MLRRSTRVDGRSYVKNMLESFRSIGGIILGHSNNAVFFKAIQQSTNNMLMIDCVVPATGEPFTMHLFEDMFYYGDVLNVAIPISPVSIDYDRVTLPIAIPFHISEIIRSFLVVTFPKINLQTMQLTTNLKRRRVDNTDLTIETVDMIHKGRLYYDLTV